MRIDQNPYINFGTFGNQTIKAKVVSGPEAFSLDLAEKPDRVEISRQARETYEANICGQKKSQEEEESVRDEFLTFMKSSREAPDRPKKKSRL